MKDNTKQIKSVEILKDLVEKKIGDLSVNEYVKLAEKAVKLGYEYIEDRFYIIEYFGRYYPQARENSIARELMTEFMSFESYSKKDLVDDTNWNYLDKAVKKAETQLNEVNNNGNLPIL